MATKPRNIKTRADDQRGARKGTTTMKPAHGGSIGQAPYIPTPRDRAFVLRHCYALGPYETARRIGITKRSLYNHFPTEIRQSKVITIERLDRTAIEQALAGNSSMLRFVLRGRQDSRFNHLSRRRDEPAANVNVNVDIRALLTNMSEAELGVAIKLFDQLITAAGTGLDPGADGGKTAVPGPAARNQDRADP